MIVFLQKRWAHWWNRMPGELRGVIMTVVTVLGILVVTGIIINLENLWTSFANSITTDAIKAGVLLFLATIGLSILWLLVWGRFEIGRAHTEAVRQVADTLTPKVNELESIVADRLPLTMVELKACHSEVTERISNAWVEYQAWGNQWFNRADRLLNETEKLHLHDLLLTRPWEYIQYIKDADDAYSTMNPGAHTELITLYGTMVGFAFLLPDALRNHACRSHGQFKTLRIIASNATTKIGKKDRSLAPYPLYLSARVTEEVFSNCMTFCPRITSGCELKIEICYLDHDLLTAAISFPGTQTVVLQALDPTTFNLVLEGSEPHKGFRSVNIEGREDACDRYEAVLDNIAAGFRLQDRANTRLKKCEIWHFSTEGGQPKLTIAAAHWVYDSEQVTRILPQNEYEASCERTYQFNGKNEIMQIVKALQKKIHADDNDVDSLQHAVASKKKAWAERYTMECPCKSAKSSGQSSL